MKLDTSYLFDVSLSMLLEQQVVSGSVCERWVMYAVVVSFGCYQVCEQGAATTTPKKNEQKVSFEQM